MSFLDSAISTIGPALAQTAVGELSNATGYNIGGTINALFGGNQQSGGQNINTLMQALAGGAVSGLSTDQISYLQSELTQQKQMLTDIGNKLSSIENSVAQIVLQNQQILDALTKIEQQQLYANWQMVNINVVNYVTTIQTCYQLYSQYVANAQHTGKTDINNLMTNIINANNGPLNAINVINTNILGSGQQKGLLQLWSEMVMPLIQGGLMDYRDAVTQYMEYYKKLAFAQLTATNLVMEYYSYQNEPTNRSAFYNNYKQVLLSQEVPFLNWLMPLVCVAVSADNKYPGANANPGFTGIDSSIQLNPNFATLQNGTQYYAPSRIFRQAEQLLASLYCTGSADRRMVVYMEYFAYTSNLLSNLPLTLTSDDNTMTINADYASNLGSPFNYLPTGQEIDYNWGGSNALNIRRFIFNGKTTPIPENQFTITNLNGVGNLVPMQTYKSSPGTTPFLANSILTYTMAVNGSSKFDFMNFVAYNTPYFAQLSVGYPSTATTKMAMS